jgi:hypothetical protein
MRSSIFKHMQRGRLKLVERVILSPKSSGLVVCGISVESLGPLVAGTMADATLSAESSDPLVLSSEGANPTRTWGASKGTICIADFVSSDMELRDTGSTTVSSSSDNVAGATMASESELLRGTDGNAVLLS